MTTIPDVSLDPKHARELGRQADIIAAATTERNRLILEATKAGASTREIADAVGLSNVGVWRIIQRADPTPPRPSGAGRGGSTNAEGGECE